MRDVPSVARGIRVRAIGKSVMTRPGHGALWQVPARGVTATGRAHTVRPRPESRQDRVAHIGLYRRRWRNWKGMDILR
jgi:hypothetical protein